MKIKEYFKDIEAGTIEEKDRVIISGLLEMENVGDGQCKLIADSLVKKIKTIPSNETKLVYQILFEQRKIPSFDKMLKSLSSREYLSTDLEDYQGIIMHGCANKNLGEYINSSLVYGDYYFLESLKKIT